MTLSKTTITMTLGIIALNVVILSMAFFYYAECQNSECSCQSVNMSVRFFIALLSVIMAIVVVTCFLFPCQIGCEYIKYNNKSIIIKIH